MNNDNNVINENEVNDARNKIINDNNSNNNNNNNNNNNAINTA